MTAPPVDASVIVTFDIAPAVTAAAPVAVVRERWDAMPPASQEFEASRAAIEARVKALVESLVRARKPREARTLSQ